MTQTLQYLGAVRVHINLEWIGEPTNLCRKRLHKDRNWCTEIISYNMSRTAMQGDGVLTWSITRRLDILLTQTRGGGGMKLEKLQPRHYTLQQLYSYIRSPFLKAMTTNTMYIEISNRSFQSYQTVHNLQEKTIYLF